jgi:hypothetical protein
MKERALAEMIKSPKHIAVACALCVIATVIAISISATLIWPKELADDGLSKSLHPAAEAVDPSVVWLSWNHINELVDYSDQLCDEACDARNESVTRLTESTRAATILATLRTIVDTHAFRDETDALLKRSKQIRASMTSHLSALRRKEASNPMLSPASSPCSSDSD